MKWKWNEKADWKKPKDAGDQREPFQTLFWMHHPSLWPQGSRLTTIQKPHRQNQPPCFGRRILGYSALTIAPPCREEARKCILYKHMKALAAKFLLLVFQQLLLACWMAAQNPQETYLRCWQTPVNRNQKQEWILLLLLLKGDFFTSCLISLKHFYAAFLSFFGSPTII